MANPYFQFKQFRVYHDRCAMKVGTDGVLLGSWACMEGNNRILDVGSGSGLIALMAAQRSKARIDAVEIDERAYCQSIENIRRSPWKERIQVYHESFSSFYKRQNPCTYDRIVSNPPFFSASLLPPDAQRQVARHTDESLSLNELISGSSFLLNEKGRLAFILPASCEEEIKELLVTNHLFLQRKTLVRPTPASPPKRILIEAGTECGIVREDELVIEISRHVYSEEYKTLTKDFYLDK